MNSVGNSITKKSNPKWRAIFTLLLIVNLIFLGFWLLAIRAYDGLGFLGVLPYLFILAIIDLIAVFSHIIKKHPHGGSHGITRVIIDAALIVIVLVLILAAIFIYGFRPR